MSEANGKDIGIQSLSTPIFNQSANTLFRFFNKFEYLQESIENMKLYSRYVKEDVSYLGLNQNGEPINTIAFPMICFCDIHLHKLKLHMEGDNNWQGYGKYGIGLNKGSYIPQNIQPIHYMNYHSDSTKDFTNIFNIGLKDVEDGKFENEDIFNYLLKELLIKKPLSGIMERKDLEDDKETKINKNFHDECEWRFLPDLSNSEIELPEIMIDIMDAKKMTSSYFNDYSNSLKVIPQSCIELEPNMINYIFVSSEVDKIEFIKFLTEKFSEPKIACDMASKIVVYETIEKDW